eukprot:7039064-Heterocapsa_arctica.AAC.1
MTHDESCKILGGELGGINHFSKRWQTTGDKLTTLHDAIGEIDHGPTEFVLKAACADVCKATYTLRLQGDHIPNDELGYFTKALRNSLGETLGGSLSDNAWLQATCGMKDGGVGFRTPGEIAIPAFVASRFTARPGAR